MNFTITHNTLFVIIDFIYSPCKVYEAGRPSANKCRYAVTRTWRFVYLFAILDSPNSTGPIFLTIFPAPYNNTATFWYRGLYAKPHVCGCLRKISLIACLNAINTFLSLIWVATKLSQKMLKLCYTAYNIHQMINNRRKNTAIR